MADTQHMDHQPAASGSEPARGTGREYDYPPSCLRRLGHAEVTALNLAAAADGIVAAISASDFVAIDLEFSGLGDNLRASDMQERYDAIVRNVSDYGILSIGLACFSRAAPAGSAATDASAAPSSVTWSASLFDILLRRDGSYKVSSKSLVFLAQTGFDFQRQALYGARYVPGSLDSLRRVHADTANLRRIFAALRTTRLVTHNGLLDLAFLYHGFFDALPPKVDSFIADLAHLFPRGIYDTKLVGECKESENRTALAYLFRKAERTQDTLARRGRPHFSVTFPQLVTDSAAADRAHAPADAQQPAWMTRSPNQCPDLVKRGHCRRDLQCGYTHDLDVLLDAYFQRSGGEYRSAAAVAHDIAAVLALQDTTHLDKFSSAPSSSVGGNNNGRKRKLPGVRTESLPDKRARTNEDGNSHAVPAPAQPSSEGEIALLTDEEAMVATSAVAAATPAASPLAPATYPLASRPNFLLDADSPASPALAAPALPPSPAASAHSGHVDAFMTGFIFAHYVQCNWVALPADRATLAPADADEWAHKLFLSGKNLPLILRKSAFAEHGARVAAEIALHAPPAPVSIITPAPTSATGADVALSAAATETSAKDPAASKWESAFTAGTNDVSAAVKW
ncbi:hypothetical protein H9P43_010064 [Blastocladiella emersonii ATCC 22665]|nr:hypothetical protein H9P43_010064 [Blastocladiella emersonii ATCC 22665]